MSGKDAGEPQAGMPALHYRRVRQGRLKPVLYTPSGGSSVLVNGAVFKTVSETARAGSGRFDSYTPPPTDCRLLNADCGFYTAALRFLAKEDSHYGFRTDESTNSLFRIASYQTCRK